ncbi:hypothetical protein PLESTB_001525900 [Pleodorina starrii]|uniref:Uncharacterized protein n=1 Tax=Pleodorina starrii TaxID=330485 RepID=A0A9W6F8M0_9CHLO|nr:hypothetical protein PLESTM_001167900 [Pleodorina starrii]GLC59716.1 hypothetical protein PLESTB_001525900 [Pleodorina starrii]GLC75362.1 hypothetical protein PLESTF_001628000 [Pleodorina starrii]
MVPGPVEYVDISPPQSVVPEDTIIWPAWSFQLLLVASEYCAALLEFMTWAFPEKWTPLKLQVADHARQFIRTSAAVPPPPAAVAPPAPGGAAAAGCLRVRNAHSVWAAFTYCYFHGLPQPEPSDREGDQDLRDATRWLRRMVGETGWLAEGPVCQAVRGWVKSVLARLGSTFPDIAQTSAREWAAAAHGGATHHRDVGTRGDLRVSDEEAKYMPLYPLRVTAEGRTGRNQLKWTLLGIQAPRSVHGRCGVPSEYKQTQNCALGYLVLADVIEAFCQAFREVIKPKLEGRDDAQKKVIQDFIDIELPRKTETPKGGQLHDGLLPYLASCALGWKLAVQHLPLWLEAAAGSAASQEPRELVMPLDNMWPVLHQQPQPQAAVEARTAGAAAVPRVSLNRSLALRLPGGMLPPSAMSPAPDGSITFQSAGGGGGGDGHGPAFIAPFAAVQKQYMQQPQPQPQPPQPQPQPPPQQQPPPQPPPQQPQQLLLLHQQQQQQQLQSAVLMSHQPNPFVAVQKQPQQLPPPQQQQQHPGPSHLQQRFLYQHHHHHQQLYHQHQQHQQESTAPPDIVVAAAGPADPRLAQPIQGPAPAGPLAAWDAPEHPSTAQPLPQPPIPQRCYDRSGSNMSIEMARNLSNTSYRRFDSNASHMSLEEYGALVHVPTLSSDDTWRNILEGFRESEEAPGLGPGPLGIPADSAGGGAGGDFPAMAAGRRVPSLRRDPAADAATRPGLPAQDDAENLHTRFSQTSVVEEGPQPPYSRQGSLSRPAAAKPFSRLGSGSRAETSRCEAALPLPGPAPGGLPAVGLGWGGRLAAGGTAAAPAGAGGCNGPTAHPSSGLLDGACPPRWEAADGRQPQGTADRHNLHPAGDSLVGDVALGLFAPPPLAAPVPPQPHPPRLGLPMPSPPPPEHYPLSPSALASGCTITTGMLSPQGPCHGYGYSHVW